MAYSSPLRYSSELSSPNKDIVLVAEDEPLIVRVVTMSLSAAGFRAAVGEDGAAALEIYHSQRDEICFVLTDVLMPVMNGVQLADRIRQIDPKLPILLMTGYFEHQLVTDASSRYPIVRKPFLQADLMRRIQSILDAAAATAG